MSACEGCLRRAWLLGRLAGHLDPVRERVLALLELADEDLIAAVGGNRSGQLLAEHAAFSPTQLRDELAAAGAASLCIHREPYPRSLRELAAAPAALFLRGDPALLAVPGAVALVGSRRASPGGTAFARHLGAHLARAGVVVISGLALGIDGAAHEGALDAGAGTIAVLPAGPERPYPLRHAGLWRRIAARGLTVSELPPGSEVRRWGFPARNRLIAGLAAATVVLEAGERSGALVTARLARELGRPVGAVPGRIGAAGAAGPHRLIRAGATLVTSAEEVLDLVLDEGARPLVEQGRPGPDGELGTVFELVAGGLDSPGALEAAGVPADRGLAALAALELTGYLHREPGGRYAVCP